MRRTTRRAIAAPCLAIWSLSRGSVGTSVHLGSKATNPAQELQKLGGAQVILATAPDSKAMSGLIDGLGPNGKLVVTGATFDPIEVTPLQLLAGSKAIQGWATGTPADSDDTLNSPACVP